MSIVQVQASPGRRSTVSEIAHELGCHPSAVVRWLTRGAALKTGERIRLEGVKIPGGWRIVRSDLEKFLAVLTDDSLRPSATDIPKPAPNAARVAKMREELRAAGY